MSHCIVATADASFVERVNRVLGDPPGRVQQLSPLELLDDPSEICRLSPEEPAAVFLGPDLDVGAALRLAHRFDVERPDVSVVLVVEPAPELWRAALRAGARDVLPPSASDAELHDVLVRAQQSSAARRKAALSAADADPRSRILAVASPKGGCGKTTVATNLAVGLARSAPQNTVLVDLDLHFGDVATALAMTPEHDVASTLGAVTSGDALELKTYLTRHESGLYVLAAPASMVEADRITGVHVAQLLELLAAEFRYVVADTAPGLSEHTLAALEHARDWLLVCSMDVSGVRGLRRQLDTLAEVGLAAAQQRVVLNLADTSTGLTRADVEQALGRPVDVALPRSKEIALSGNRGVPLLLEAPRSPAGRALQSVVDLIAPPDPAAAPKPFWRRAAKGAA